MTLNKNITGNDQALLFQKGNEQALAFFFHELYPALAHYSFQLTQSRPLAEEIASEAFVKTWRMHFKLDSYPGIKAYLYKIVHRDSVEAICRQNQKARAFGLPLTMIDADTPFDCMLRSETCRLVHAALKQLTPATRRVVSMHFLDGKTTGQIARELNLHPSTIKTQKKQGLDALRKVLVRPVLALINAGLILCYACGLQ